MKNTELRAFVENKLNGMVSKGARIEFTQHGNGYCVCVRAPHVNGMTGTVEYSLPETFMVWGIMSREAIEDKITSFMRFNKHFAA